MVRLHEYQGKQLLKTIGVSVPEGDVACTPKEARKIAEARARCRTRTLAIHKGFFLQTERFKTNFPAIEDVI